MMMFTAVKLYLYSKLHSIILQKAVILMQQVDYQATVEEEYLT